MLPKQFHQIPQTQSQQQVQAKQLHNAARILQTTARLLQLPVKQNG